MIWIIVGAGLLIAGVVMGYHLHRTIKICRDGTRVTATVVSYSIKSNRGWKMHVPVYSWTADGVRYSQEGWSADYKPKYLLGHKLEAYCHPDYTGKLATKEQENVFLILTIVLSMAGASMMILAR